MGQLANLHKSETSTMRMMLSGALICAAVLVLSNAQDTPVAPPQPTAPAATGDPNCADKRDCSTHEFRVFVKENCIAFCNQCDFRPRYIKAQEAAAGTTSPTPTVPTTTRPSASPSRTTTVSACTSPGPAPTAPSGVDSVPSSPPVSMRSTTAPSTETSAPTQTTVVSPDKTAGNSATCVIYQ